MAENVARRVCLEYLTATDPDAELKAYYALRSVCVKASKDLFIPRPLDRLIETSAQLDESEPTNFEAFDYARELASKRALVEAVEIEVLIFLKPYVGKSPDELERIAASGAFDSIGNRVYSRVISLIRRRNCPAAKLEGDTVSLSTPVGVSEDGDEVTLGQALGVD